MQFTGNNSINDVNQVQSQSSVQRMLKITASSLAQIQRNLSQDKIQVKNSKQDKLYMIYRIIQISRYNQGITELRQDNSQISNKIQKIKLETLTDMINIFQIQKQSQLEKFVDKLFDEIHQISKEYNQFLKPLSQVSIKSRNFQLVTPDQFDIYALTKIDQNFEDIFKRYEHLIEHMNRSLRQISQNSTIAQQKYTPILNQLVQCFNEIYQKYREYFDKTEKNLIRLRDTKHRKTIDKIEKQSQEAINKQAKIMRPPSITPIIKQKLEQRQSKINYLLNSYE